jgi:hypothetical protein
MTEYHLATVAPIIRRIRIPLFRDQALLLLIALNNLFLGVETYLAHSISGTIVPEEWTPILYGPVAGLILIIIGLIATRKRMAANILGTIVFTFNIAVGVLGSFYHLSRAILMSAEAGQQVSVPLLVFAPPVLGPITFALLGVLGISAAWQEVPAGSGSLVLWFGRKLNMPFSKTRAYFLLTGIGVLITVISSIIDHSHSGFSNPWTWIPTIFGVFATAVAIYLGFLDKPEKNDLMVYTITMLVMMGVGLLGSLLHISQNLVAEGAIVGERFIRGAPIFAPMLFADMGMLGLIVLLDPGE